ncbi:MAG: ABC transporter ATP-binding protein [Clostridiales bacterium]
MSLVIKNITKKYSKKKYALNSVNMEIPNGIYGLVGPNGAGKTTLMRILVGLIKPNEGEIFLNNQCMLKNIDYFRQKIGYLPQEFGCYKNLTVKECMNTIAILKGLNNKNKRLEQIDKILKEVNLSNESLKKVGNLSGGMRRRLGIAQTIIGNPLLIIVDEPTAGLDPEERIRFRGVIRKIATNRIILISTHIIEDVKNNCDGISLIKNGVIKQFNSFKEFEELSVGKVWQKTISEEEFELYENKYNILSSNTIDNKLVIRIYSDERISNAEIVKPSAEEGYLSWIKK